MNNRPIGILDSGVGGLSVWKEIVQMLPNESTIYLADSINCPYGDRSEEEIFSLAKRLIQFLVEKKVKLVIVACNTITVVCIDRLRVEFENLPIVGLVPAVKTAAEKTKNKRIGILSTPITARSAYQKNLIEKFAKEYDVVNVGTEELVPLIERGQIDSKSIKKILRKILNEFIIKDVDMIVLGCSHFPFLRDSIGEVMGDKIKILDSGEAVARQVKRVLSRNNSFSLLNNPSHLFYTTGGVKEFAKVSKKLVGGRFEDLIKSARAVLL